MSLRRVFFVDGVRTAFQSSGTGYKHIAPYELASHTLSALANNFTRVDLRNEVDYVVCGNVIQDSKTSNIARESMLLSGYNKRIPSHTVSMACISSNRSISDAVDMISRVDGGVSSVIAGGVESMSDLPIKISKPLRQLAFESRRFKGVGDYVKGIFKLKMKDLSLEVPSITEFSTNETMGYSAEKLSHKWGVSRSEQDEFAFRSHKSASIAEENGLLSDVIKINTPQSINKDNVIKHSTSLKKLESLKPTFMKKYGTITAGNASSLTDGASACLITDESFLEKYGVSAKAEIVDYVYCGSDPKSELLLGPAYAISMILKKNNLTIDSIGVVEIHEAFAGQVLANLNALDSNAFYENEPKVGMIPMDKINKWGGSLSLGHPFGATGVRLVSMASNRLKHENEEYALIASCAAGGLGHAMLLRSCI